MQNKFLYEEKLPAKLSKTKNIQVLDEYFQRWASEYKKKKATKTEGAADIKAAFMVFR